MALRNAYAEVPFEIVYESLGLTYPQSGGNTLSNPKHSMPSPL